MSRSLGVPACWHDPQPHVSRVRIEYLYSDRVLTIVGRVRDVERVVVLDLAPRVFACLLFYLLLTTAAVAWRRPRPAPRVSPPRARVQSSRASQRTTCTWYAGTGEGSGACGERGDDPSRMWSGARAWAAALRDRVGSGWLTSSRGRCTSCSCRTCGRHRRAASAAWRSIRAAAAGRWWRGRAGP